MGQDVANGQVMALMASLLMGKFANGHRWMEMSVQLAARRRQVASPAFSDTQDIGYRAPMN